jgi:hypothetical protein
VDLPPPLLLLLLLLISTAACVPQIGNHAIKLSMLNNLVGLTIAAAAGAMLSTVDLPPLLLLMLMLLLLLPAICAPRLATTPSSCPC